MIERSSPSNGGSGDWYSKLETPLNSSLALAVDDNAQVVASENDAFV